MAAGDLLLARTSDEEALYPPRPMGTIEMGAGDTLLVRPPFAGDGLRADAL